MAFITNIDNLVENFFLSVRGPLGVKFFAAITWLGEWKLVVFFIILTLVLLWLKNKKDYILAFLITVLGAEISGQIAKIIFERARPIGNSEMGDPFSFPSGHALIAAAFYGFLIYFCWRVFQNHAQKYFFLTAGLILILLIGVSRLYLGVHFFSDVIGGYILGAIWLAVGIYIQQKKSKTGEV